MQVNPSVFKAYDIRGVYPDELNDESAYKIGQGFANYAKSSPIIVGYDTRVSSPALRDAVINGLTDQGVDVIDIGFCSTSCFYYTVANSGLGGGMMITASHNSKEFNGFKPVLKDATPLTKEQALDLKKIILADQWPMVSVKGKITKDDPTAEYVQTVRSSLKGQLKPLRVVMDAGNGMAGLYIEKVFSDTGLSLIPIYTELDGNFPNHETNPKIAENRMKLVEKILAEKADLGFMFDGDADRLCILDRHGQVIDYSLVMAVIAEYLVKNSSGGIAVIEVRTSKVVRDWVEKAGGKVIVSSCWTIPIKLEMKTNQKVVFGGETSGHYIFPQMRESDDGIFGALAFLQAISARTESIDDIIKSFKEKYFVLEETNFTVADKNEANSIIESLRNKYEKQGGQILEVDGLSVVFPDWWFNLRQSNTEPVIRLNFEADSPDLFAEKKAELLQQLSPTSK